MATLLVFLGMSALLVATVTSAAVNGVIAGALTAVTGIQTVAGKLRAEKAALHRAKVSSNRLASRRTAVLAERNAALVAANAGIGATLGRTRTRATRGATRAILSAPLKAAPFAGAVVVAALTAHELADGCALLNEAAADSAIATPLTQNEQEHRMFCRDNAERLEALEARLEPVLKVLDEPELSVWPMANELIEAGERSAGALQRLLSING